MALHGSLKIGGRTYGVMECEYEFTQNVDQTGKPTARPEGGIIKIVIPSTNDDDMFFYNWMFHKSEAKSGILRFRLYTTDNKISYKTVSFANAYCIYLHDFFSDQDSKLMYTTIKISAQVIRVGAANFSMFINNWSDNPVNMVLGNLGDFLRDTLADKINPL